MAWREYVPHAVAGTGGTVGVLLLVFRESITKAMNEFWTERRMAREAKAAASGGDKQMANAFISLLKSDLESQGRTREEMARAIGQLAKSVEAVLDTQRLLSNQLNDMQRDLLMVKGAVMGGGRFQ